MKKIWVFVLGVIVGFVLTVVISVCIANFNSNVTGLNIFEQPGDCLIEHSDLKVFQVIAPNAALTEMQDTSSSPVFLLVNDNENTYYDDQVIKLTQGKCFRQIGTYRYMTGMKISKTVPVVQMM